MTFLPRCHVTCSACCLWLAACALSLREKKKMLGIFLFVLEVFWIRGRLCVCLCASVCVSSSMSILDRCEMEAAVIKRIRCFLLDSMCVWQCRHKMSVRQTVCMANYNFGSVIVCARGCACVSLSHSLSLCVCAHSSKT